MESELSTPHHSTSSHGKKSDGNKCTLVTSSIFTPMVIEIHESI